MRSAHAALLAAAAVLAAGCAGPAIMIAGAAKASSEGVVHESPGTTALHRAAYQQDVAEARRLIANGASINARNEKGDTPLSFALMRRTGPPVSVEMLDLLLAAGADPNVKESWYGKTALQAAVGSGDAELAAMRLLIARGAQVDATPGLHGWTPLMEAVKSGRIEAARLLIASGADVRNQRYVGAALRAPGVCEKHLAGPTPECPGCMDASAFLPERLAMVKLLIDAGAPLYRADLEEADRACMPREFSYGPNRLARIARDSYPISDAIPPPAVR